jgi:hypothetical protein
MSLKHCRGGSTQGNRATLFSGNARSHLWPSMHRGAQLAFPRSLDFAKLLYLVHPQTGILIRLLPHRLSACFSSLLFRPADLQLLAFRRRSVGQDQSHHRRRQEAQGFSGTG